MNSRDSTARLLKDACGCLCVNVQRAGADERDRMVRTTEKAVR